MNPFVVLMYEGLFGFALTFFFFFFPHYFQDVKELFTETKKTLGTFILFIFVLFLYIILSGLKNIFRIVTSLNKIYSPMAKMLTDYFLNPLYFIYYCISLDDFKDKKIGKINIPYLTLNITIAIIISFCGCLYNEFIILFCCGLERNTHLQISERADKSLLTELAKVNSQTSSIDFTDTNSTLSNKSDKESENI